MAGQTFNGSPGECNAVYQQTFTQISGPFFVVHGTHFAGPGSPSVRSDVFTNCLAVLASLPNGDLGNPNQPESLIGGRPNPPQDKAYSWLLTGTVFVRARILTWTDRWSLARHDPDGE